MITTKGFRDVLELGRRNRPQPYGMTGTFTPVIPRDLRLEIPERMDAQGRVVTPLDETALRAAIAALLEQGREKPFASIPCTPIPTLPTKSPPPKPPRDPRPNAHITCGHHLLSESREFERGVTAAVNAAVQPLLERYVARLATELRGRGYPRDLLVMNGNGGMVEASNVSREAVKTVMSGPASGVMAALATGRRAGCPNLLTYDMGGTSTDVAMIRNGRAPVSNEIEVEYAMPIHVPMVDVRTVGAGGGSIARVDAGGMLRVGPESAGSTPGPICYGRGGTRVTISDANLILGRLPADRFGQAAEDARRAMHDQIARPLGLSTEAAAEAVIRIANTHMAGAIRMVPISLGADPRDFPLFAFGGAGPLHAPALPRELAIPRVLPPARPGTPTAAARPAPRRVPPLGGTRGRNPPQQLARACAASASPAARQRGRNGVCAAAAAGGNPGRPSGGPQQRGIRPIHHAVRQFRAGGAFSLQQACRLGSAARHQRPFG